MTILCLPKWSLISSLMTSSTKWDFSPLQPFPRDMPTISLTPLGTKKKPDNNSWQIETLYFFLPSEKRLYLEKKNYEYDTKWIVFFARRDSRKKKEKKLEGIQRNCFFYFLQMPFSLLFIWACRSIEVGEEAWETIVIQLLNLKFNLWTPRQCSDSLSLPFFCKTKPLKQNMGEITVGWNLLNCFSELHRRHFYVAKIILLLLALMC